jgi:hypothetical protein
VFGSHISFSIFFVIKDEIVLLEIFLGENMDNRHLRSILLNLQYRLSDNDRERLHFYLKNDVPRTLGDDSTLNGTLRLMQSLFDQDKINERDFTLLIDAFKQIQCFDAVNLLKGFFFLFEFYLVLFYLCRTPTSNAVKWSQSINTEFSLNDAITH